MNSKYWLIFCVFLCACGQSNKSVAPNATPADTLSVVYARGFSLVRHEHYTEAIVYNPWKNGSVQARYFLLTDSTQASPTNGTRLIVPLQKIAAASCTHIGFLDALNELPSVAGAFQPHLIYNNNIRQRVAEGKITDLGDPLQIDVEKVLALQPQMVMISGYGQNDVSAERLAQMGIPLIYNNEWTEQTPLARAEWIKFVAAFYGQEALADSLFGEIEKKYDHLRTLSSQVSARKTLMTGGNFRGTWYMPSGQTYMGRFFADAAADYFYATDSTQASLPLNIETVLRHFSKANVWVGSSANSLRELREIDEKHTLFAAYQNAQVYNFNRRTLPSGANDFWETGVVQPHLVLSDLLQTLYPELLPNYTPFFIEKLP